MKVTIELEKRTGVGLDTNYLDIRVDYHGEVYRKIEMLDDTIMTSIFDRIFERAKEEIKKSIPEGKE